MDPQLQRLLKDPSSRYFEALTIGYLVALRGYEKPAGMEQANEDFERGLALGAEARKNGPVPFFIGYHADEDLPIKKGQEVTIPAGVRVTHRGETKLSTKTRKVRVDHILGGSNYRIRKAHFKEEVDVISAPTVRWAGRGGYWSEVDINEIPEAVEAAKEAQRQAEHQAKVAHAEVQIQRVKKVLERIREAVNHDIRPEGVLGQVREAFDRTTKPEGFGLFSLCTHLGDHYFQVDAVIDDAVVAGYVVDTVVEDGKLVFRINVTSSICQPIAGARQIFHALVVLMAQANRIDKAYCQPWNQDQ